jgi:hypothetical protein
MNGRFQMQGGKNWILPKEVNANRFFWDSHWLEIWSNHFCPSMGLNGGSVATDSGLLNTKCLQPPHPTENVPPFARDRVRQRQQSPQKDHLKYHFIALHLCQLKEGWRDVGCVTV